MQTLRCATCNDRLPEGATECPRDGTPVQLEKTAITKPDPLIGARLGEYVVQKQIGMGGMGIVYQGIQPQIAKQVAIKVLRADIAADPSQVERLLAEAQAVNAIRHRSIIDIFGFGAVPDGRHYVVMELLDGEPLDVLLKRMAPMRPLEAIPLLEEILSALGAAHGRGVIHRDLKPSNVFVATQADGSRYLKLLDFGLAKRSALPNSRTAQTNDGSVSGTPDYIAPEQARGEAVGPETDHYALGILAFEMLTGTLPFTAPTPIELLMKHLNEEAPVPSHVEESVPAGLDEVVKNLLKKEMSDRPSSAELVRAELKRISRELMQAATQQGRHEEPAPRVTGEHHATTKVVPATTLVGLPTKRTIWPIVAGVAVAGAVLAAVVWFRPARPAPKPYVPVVAALPPEPVAPPPPTVVGVKPPEPAPIQPPPVEPTPVEAPKPVAVAAKGERRAPKAHTVKALQQRVTRLEAALIHKAGPGEEADPQALSFLKKKRLELTFTSAPEDLSSISNYLDLWEKSYLR